LASANLGVTFSGRNNVVPTVSTNTTPKKGNVLEGDELVEKS